MNRFSLKNLTSNISTIVRIAVSFFVVSLATVWVVAPRSEAETTTVAPSVQLTMDQYLKQQEEERKNREQTACNELEEKLSKATSEITSACANGKLGSSTVLQCVDKFNNCRAGETHDAEMLASAEDNDDIDEDTEKELCKQTARCPGLEQALDGRSYKDEQREYDKSRKESQKSLNRLNKRKMDSQRKLAEKQQELQEKTIDAAAELEKAQRKVSDGVSDAFKEVKGRQQAEFQNYQDNLNKLDEAYAKMRQESRQYATQIEQAKDEVIANCTAEAEAKMAKKTSRKKSNIGSATGLAGSTKRKIANLTKLYNYQFNEYVNACLSGQTANGQNQANKVKAAQRAQALSNQYFQEQSALIEKQRASLSQRLNQMSTQADQDNQEILKKAQEQLQDLQNQQQRVMQKNQSAYYQMMQSTQADANAIDQEIAQETQELQTATMKANLAGKKASCSGSNAAKSESALSQIAKSWGTISSQLERIPSLCNRFARQCGATYAVAEEAPKAANTPVSTAQYTLPSVCKALENRAVQAPQPTRSSKKNGR